MKRAVLILLTLFSVLSLLSQHVEIPDKAFLHALIEEGVDTDGDSLISYSEAEAVSYLNVSGSSRNQGEIIDITGIEAFINLDSLSCNSNGITALDLSNNTKLRYLSCHGYSGWGFDYCNLETLDLSNNPLLTYLDCSHNRLSSLDVSNNTALTELDCSDNQLTSLDVSGNISLTTLSCGSNQITGLYIFNNQLLTFFRISDMPSLVSVCVWTLPFPPSYIRVLSNDSPNINYTLDCAEHIIYLPDTAFLHALIEEGVDINADSLISHSEANMATDLNISGYGIRDLTGILAFRNLDTLICSTNSFERLDLSNSKGLSYLDCSSGQISDLSLGKNTSLTYLDCSNNQITDLYLDNKIALAYLDCSNNQIRGLDISNGTMIKWLDISHIPSLSEVCVWTEPFPPTGIAMDSSYSPDAYFTSLCECDGDYFEDNDEQWSASLVSEDAFYEDLFVSFNDDDWFQLHLLGDTLIGSVSITCDFDHTGGDIQMDLLDIHGTVLASSNSETDGERIDFTLDPLESYFLHVYLHSDISNSYTLNWGKRKNLCDSELVVCRTDKECDTFDLDPLCHDKTYRMDTLTVDLLSGEQSGKILSIRNHGPDPYCYYAALNCSEIPNDLHHAIRFDGVSGNIWIRGDQSLCSANMTLEAWIRPETGGAGESPIIAKVQAGHGYELFISGEKNDRRLCFRVGNHTIHSRRVIRSDQWYHVAVTFDNQVIRLYINGIIDQKAYATESMYNAFDLFIGSNGTMYEPCSYFRGDIDEVRLWNRARSDREIHAYMHRPLSGSEPGLVGYWPMEKGGAPIVIDHVSEHQGQMIGGATRTGSSAPVINLVRCSPELEIAQPGSEADIQLQFNASDVVGRDYFADIQLISHDPGVPDIVLPMKLNVTDAPSFYVDPVSVSLNGFDLYRTVNRELEVVNHGSLILNIDSVKTGVLGSRVTPSTAVIEPGESQTFAVNVFRRTLDCFNGDITFYTNDPFKAEVAVPLIGEAPRIVDCPLLYQIVDTIIIGYFKGYGIPFTNESTTHDLVLEPSVVTYSLPGEPHDRILKPDFEPGDWVITFLPEISTLEPGGVTWNEIKLDASHLEQGDYYADVILEWHNPGYHKGFIPIQMHARHPLPGELPVDLTNGGGNDLLLYPNPVIDILTIRLKDHMECAVELISLNGPVILQEEFSGSSFHLDLSSFREGVYFITITSKDFVATRKIIKL